MTRDEIISMALEAGLQSIKEHWGTVYRAVGPSNLEYFATLVAAREREMCAKVAETETYLSRVSWSSVLGDDAVSHCHVAAAIRARAEK